MFNMAIMWGRAQKNPTKGIKFFKEPEEKDRILLPEEEDKLFEAIHASKQTLYLEPLVVAAINTGMRRGELINLKWSNVDFASCVITVEGTKSGHIRKIPMNIKLTNVLLGAKNGTEYVFLNSKGKRCRAFRNTWESVLKKAGIEGLNFHALRHTFGTRLGMLGTDIKSIQELMGHADIHMTMRYSHPTPEYKRNAVEKLCEVNKAQEKVPTIFKAHEKPGQTQGL
jgi:integrase